MFKVWLDVGSDVSENALNVLAVIVKVVCPVAGTATATNNTAKIKELFTATLVRLSVFRSLSCRLHVTVCHWWIAPSIPTKRWTDRFAVTNGHALFFQVLTNLLRKWIAIFGNRNSTKSLISADFMADFRFRVETIWQDWRSSWKLTYSQNDTKLLDDDSEEHLNVLLLLLPLLRTVGGVWFLSSHRFRRDLDPPPNKTRRVSSFRRVLNREKIDEQDFTTLLCHRRLSHVLLLLRVYARVPAKEFEDLIGL